MLIFLHGKANNFYKCPNIKRPLSLYRSLSPSQHLDTINFIGHKNAMSSDTYPI
jgi:hypothetical protein